MTKAQRRVLEHTLDRQFSVSPFDVKDPEERQLVAAAVERWADTWIRHPIKDVLRVDDGILSSKELLYYHPGA